MNFDFIKEKEKVFSIFGGAIVILAISLILFYGGITGNVIVDVSDNLIEGEIIKGNLLFQENTKIPLGSVIEVKLNDQSNSIPLLSAISQEDATKMQDFDYSPPVVVIVEFYQTEESAYGGSGFFKTGSSGAIGSKGSSGFRQNDGRDTSSSGSSGSVSGNVIAESGQNIEISSSSAQFTIRYGSPAKVQFGTPHGARVISAFSEGFSIDPSEIEIFGEGTRNIAITTSHKTTLKGFVADESFSVSIDRFNIIAEPGDFSMVLSYNGVDLASTKATINPDEDDKLIFVYQSSNVQSLDSVIDSSKDGGNSCTIQECSPRGDTKHVFDGVIDLGLSTQLRCSGELNSEPVVTYIPCERVDPISIITGNENTVEIRDKEDQTVAIISKDGEKIDVSFLSSRESQRVASCFNGVKDNQESGIDCGGNCGACLYQRTYPLMQIWVFVLFFGLLIVWVVSEGGVVLSSARSLRRGQRSLDEHDIVNALNRYDEIRRKHASLAHSGQKQKVYWAGIDYHDRLVKAIKAKGLKVQSKIVRGELPEVSYPSQEVSLSTLKATHNTVSSDVDRIKRLVHDGLLKMKSSQISISKSNYYLVRGLFFNLSDKEKSQVVDLCLDYYVALKKKSSKTFALGVLARAQLKGQLLRGSSLPEI